MNMEIDLKIVGQLLSASSLLQILPSEEKTGEFLMALLKEVPGCLRAGVCFRGTAGPWAAPGGQCRDCAALRERRGGDEPYPCALDGAANIHAYPIETAERLYGYLLLDVGAAAEYGEYEPFQKNLANSLALILENRRQLCALRESVVLLEQRVRERTVKLEKTQTAMQAKDKELEEMIYVVAHDLRSPLVNIQGFSRKLADDLREMDAASGGGAMAGPDAARNGAFLHKGLPEALKYISSSATVMQDLIDRLLKVARLGRVQLNIARTEMDEVIANLLAALNFQIREAGAEIRTGPLPACQADRAQLAQVFSNLIENALKYRSPNRKAAIEISGSTLKDGMVEYCVTDNGIGITGEEADGKIWTLYYRTSPAGNIKGEGIGLATARRIIERHGGRIKADVVPDGGTKFTVQLPSDGPDVNADNESPVPAISGNTGGCIRP